MQGSFFTAIFAIINIPFYYSKLLHPVHGSDKISILKKFTFTGLIYLQVQKGSFRSKYQKSDMFEEFYILRINCINSLLLLLYENSGVFFNLKVLNSIIFLSILTQLDQNSNTNSRCKLGYSKVMSNKIRRFFLPYQCINFNM